MPETKERKEDEDLETWAMRLWRRMDRDGNSFVTRSELDSEEFRSIIRSVLTPAFKAGTMGGVEYMRSELNMTQAIHYCLRKADLNGDNALSYLEFRSFLRVLRHQDLGKSTAHLIFALFDLDQDGHINESEFREVFRFYQGHKPTEEQFQKEWAKLDARGEQRVNIAQYVKWLQASKNPIFHQHAPPEEDEVVPEPEPPSPDMRKYLPRMTFSKSQARPKWNQRFNAGVNKNDRCPQGQRNYFSKTQSLPELHWSPGDPWRLHAEVLPRSEDLGLWSYQAAEARARPRWEETFKMQAGMDHWPNFADFFTCILGTGDIRNGQVETDLEIRILQGNQLVAKGVLQASQVNDAPALAFRVVSLPLVPGPGTLEVKLRQATDAVEKKFQFQMPLARRQVISLELQNAELLKLLRARGATVATSPSSVDGVPETALLRRGEFQENSQMRHQQLLEESYAFNAQQLQRKQQLRRRLSAMKMFNSELPRLRQNLAKALARRAARGGQQQLQSEGEAKVSALQRRLAEAQETLGGAVEGLEGAGKSAGKAVEAQALVALALGRREELQRQCRDALEARREEQMSPEVAHLRKLSMEQQEELLRRREQIVQIEQSSSQESGESGSAAMERRGCKVQPLDEDSTGGDGAAPQGPPVAPEPAKPPEPPEPPEPPSPKSPKPPGQPSRRRCSIEESCKGDVENMGGARLCLPTLRGTVLSSLLSTTFIFIGLLALSAAELGLPGFPRTAWFTLVLRYLGWAFLFYIPVHFMSVPFLRNFLLWSLQPGDSIRDALAHGKGEDTPQCLGRRAAFFPYFVHTCWLSVYAILIFVSIGEEGYFGLVPVFGLGNIFMVPVGTCASILFAPPLVRRSYPFKVGPSAILFPIVGFLVVVGSYILLRRLIGPSLGSVMPLVLSAYELLGTALVCRVFTREFVVQKEVREGYLGTNQGLVVSMAICNLHAMAEGARLTLLYVDNLESQDWDILVPIISGVVWNVTVRLGGLDRFLHVVTNGWRKPNNGSRLLRESGYCMGYPRFGAVAALLLARLCINTPMPLDGPEVRLFGIVLLAEICEDLCSFVLRYIGVNMFPRSKLVTDTRREIDQSNLSDPPWLQGKGSKESAGRGKGSQESTAAAAPVTSESRISIVPTETGRRLSDKDRSDLSHAVSDRALMKSTCWSVRVAYDFRFRIEAFDPMPLWAHLLPTAMAQFHTIFAMVVFSGGLDFILGLCERVDFLGYSSADRLEDAISSLRQLSTRAELLQPSAAAETTASAAAAGTAPEWQRRVWRAEGELKELKLGGEPHRREGRGFSLEIACWLCPRKRMEALRLQQIKDLEMDQAEIVQKFKQIRDLATQQCLEEEADVEEERVAMWQDANNIREIAKEIQILLRANPDGGYPMQDDLCGGNILAVFRKIRECAWEMARLDAYRSWGSACEQIISATRKAQELLQPFLEVEAFPADSGVLTHPTATSHNQAPLAGTVTDMTSTRGEAETIDLPEMMSGGETETKLQKLEHELQELQAVHGDRDDPDIAATLLSLGSVSQEAGDLKQAKQQLEESLRIERSLHGDRDHPDVAAALLALAQVSWEAGDVKQAKGQLEESLSTMRSSHGDANHPYIAEALRQLGLLSCQAGDLEQATQQLEESLRMTRSLYGDGADPEVASILHALGQLSMQSGDLNLARKHLEESLSMFRSLYGNTAHPDTAAALLGLGRVSSQTGDLEQARRQVAESLRMMRSLHGDRDHPEIAAPLHELGVVSRKAGFLKQAKEQLEESLRIMRALHGDTDLPEIAATLHELGVADLLAGNLKQAKEQLEESLRMKRSLHTDQSGIASILDRLGAVSRQAGDLEQARQQLEESLQIKRSLHRDRDHPSIAVTLHELGVVSQQNGDLNGSKQQLEESLRMNRVLHGDNDHPEIAATLLALGQLSQKLGDLGQAEEQLEESLRMSCSLHGEDHPVSSSTLEIVNLVHSLRDLDISSEGSSGRSRS
eukprot:s214_g9.t1